MQAMTRKELAQIKGTVRQVLTECPVTRADDNALYYHDCSASAWTCTRSTFPPSFLGTPCGFQSMKAL